LGALERSICSAISSRTCAPSIPAQYNLTIQRELTKDMKLEVGYVGSQGHRLLATHDINYSKPADLRRHL